MNFKREKVSGYKQGRQTARMIYAFLITNNVQGRATGLHGLLNMEVRRSNLKMFDQAWEETLMGME